MTALVQQHSAPKTYQEIISEEMRGKKITVSELSRMTGIKQSTLHRMLNDQNRDVYFSHIVEIVRALHLPLSILDVFQENTNAHKYIPIVSLLGIIKGSVRLEEITPDNWEGWVIVSCKSCPQSKIAVLASEFSNNIFPQHTLLTLTLDVLSDNAVLFVTNQNKKPCISTLQTKEVVSCVEQVIFRYKSL